MHNTMKNYLYSLLLAFGLGSATALAVPAYPHPIVTHQPDGTSIEITLHGDEYTNWATTADGYTLLRNENGFWTFAREQAGGLAASELVYNGSTDAARASGIQPGLNFTESQIKQNRVAAAPMLARDNDLQVSGSFPSKGKRKLLLLLLNYKDTTPKYTQEQFQNMMNQENWADIGSFRDYYLEQSYGQLDIEVTVTPWINLYGSPEYYGSNGAVTMIVEGLEYIDEDIDFSEFDNDGDGVLDGLAVIHQGYGQEMTGSGNDIWSHSSEIYGLTLDGIEVCRYTIEPEMLRTGEMSTIGVICHEFGHNLGAPDFYDTDYELSGGDFAGTGIWDIMGNGAWSGYYGDRPAGFNMWQKIQYGWVNPVTLEFTSTIVDFPAAATDAAAYRINSTVPGEYYILENRQQVGPFDQALPGHGLIVYHVNESLVRSAVSTNTLNVGHPQAVYTVCAGATDDPDGTVSSYGNINSGNAPFPGLMNKSELSDYTLPSTLSQSGRFSYFALKNIAEDAEGRVSFDFIKETTPQAPINLTAGVAKGVVTLTWEMPEDAPTTRLFTIYRNGEQIGTAYDHTYVDVVEGDSKLLTYDVDVTYPDGLVSPYVSTSIFVPVNRITAVNPVVDGSNVTLRWDVNNTLTRQGSSQLEDYSTTTFRYESLDFVHRYRAVDLPTFKGFRINSITFIPLLAATQAKYTVRVWQANADGSNLKIVAENEVSEWGAAMWRTVVLDKPVTIVANREYWIGVHVEAISGGIDVITDQFTPISGYGDLMRFNDGEWQPMPDSTGNFFISADLTPASPNNPSALPTDIDVVDPTIDLQYPIGYRIYRDGEAIATTGNALFVDSDVPYGKHIYQVACLYAGDNEAVAAETDVELIDEGVADIQIAAKVVASDGFISVSAPEICSIIVADVSGRVVANTTASQAAVAVHPGIYIVKINEHATTIYVQ